MTIRDTLLDLIRKGLTVMKSLWQSRGRQPSKGSVYARATVTIEMTNLGSWGADYKMDQIIEQARDTVISRIRQYEQKHADRLRILDVKVTGVFTPEDK